MSADDKIRDKAQTAKGEAKEALGNATGNEQWQAEGKADQTKGRMKEAGEKLKDAGEKAKDALGLGDRR